MLVYLDSAQNRKGAPNENFAREVMELFTLGEGHYTEQDVKEAARAFTGWSLDRETRPLRVSSAAARRRREDGARKERPLRRRRRARPPARAPRDRGDLTAKLWREFVSPDPDRRGSAAHRRPISRVAVRHQASPCGDPDVRRVLCERESRRARQVAGRVRRRHAARLRSAAGSQALPFALAAAGMGQNLFSPPNVKGWPGGEIWINTTTLLARKQFIDRVTARRRAARCRGERRELPEDAGGNGMSVKTIAAPIRTSQRRTRATQPRGASASPADGARRLERPLRQHPMAGAASRRDAGRARPAGAAIAARRRAATARSISPPSRCPRARARARRGLSAEMTGESMDRRRFLQILACAAALRALGAGSASVAFAAAPAGRDLSQPARADRAQGRQRRPQHRSSRIADPAYYALRPEARDRARRACCNSRIARDCIRRSRRCCRSGRTASSRSCRASAIRSPTFRTSARSRSGTRHRRARSTCRTAG